jgi:hypothetical protein
LCLFYFTRLVLCSSVAGVRSPDLPPASLSSSSGRKTSLRLCCHLRQVARPSSGSVVVFVRSLDLPSAPSSSSSGRSTFLRLWRHVRQVARPSSGCGVIFVRSLDPPPASSSSSSGRWTFPHLRRRLRHVARPSSGFGVAFVRSLDLHAASLSLRQFGRPPSDLVLLAPSFYKHKNLQSDGRTHAHGMVGLLLYSFIAQQCSVLASFSFTVLFIAKAAP